MWLKCVVNAKSGRRGQGGRQGPAYEGSLKRNLDFAQSVKRSHLTVGSHGRHEVPPLEKIIWLPCGGHSAGGNMVAETLFSEVTAAIHDLREAAVQVVKSTPI